MAANTINAEPRYPLGDVAGLLDYRLRAGTMKPIDPHHPFGPLGHTYVAITCTRRPWGGELARGLEPPPDIAYLDRPDAFESFDWGRVIGITCAAVIAVAWAVLLMLVAFGVYDTVILNRIETR